MLEIQAINETHIPMILKLLTEKFISAQKALPVLPDKFTEEKGIAPNIAWILKEHGGLIAYEDGCPTAFVMSIYIDDLFYKMKGVYTPEWGHNLGSANRQTVQQLLQKVYEKMLEGGYTHHSISVINQQEELQAYFFDYGYGSRCMDGARLVTGLEVLEPCGYPIENAGNSDIEALIPMLRAHHDHMTGPATIIGFEYSDERKLLSKWLADEKVKIWVMKDMDQVIGFIKTVDGEAGGCDACYDEKSLGVETTQLLLSYRGKGLATEMIKHINNYAFEQGFTRMVVDWETINPTAQGFWPKYFTPTIRSVVKYFF